jgi:ribonucleoside-diphosphate reductase beta chain
VELEIAYAKDCLPTACWGLNAGCFGLREVHRRRRLERIGLPILYGSQNPFN